MLLLWMYFLVNINWYKNSHGSRFEVLVEIVNIFEMDALVFSFNGF